MTHFYILPTETTTTTTTTTDLVLHITPDLHELCGESFAVLLADMGLFEAMVVTLVPLSTQSSASMVSGEVLTYSSEALFATEICCLLASLEAWLLQGHCMRLGGEGFGGHNQKGGEVSLEGIYQGQNKKERRSKESFGNSLSDEPSVGRLLCRYSLHRGAPSVISLRL
jgi:hypothetical protein